MSSPGLNIFEILITDGLKKSEISTVQSLANALAYSEKLWKSPKINGEAQSAVIEDKTLGIRLKSDKVKSETTSFLISIEYQHVKEIESFKKNLYQHISGKLGFNHIKVIADSVSEQISSDMQPYILSAEKAVKRAIIESVLLNTGLSALHLPKAITDKINRKKSHSGFSKNIDHLDLLLVDFEDIGLLINKDASMKSQTVQKWAQLSLLRDQAVANVLLTASDLNEVKSLSAQLIELVAGKQLKQADAVAEKTPIVKTPAPAAVKKAPAVKTPVVKDKAATVKDKAPIIGEQKIVAVKEVEAKPIVAPVPVAEVQKTVEKEVVKEIVNEKPKPVSNHDAPSLMITEDVFLHELKKMESQKAGQKINLKAFVSETLAGMGYTTGPAYFASRSLSEVGKVEVFDTKDETGLIFKAVKSL